MKIDHKRQRGLDARAGIATEGQRVGEGKHKYFMSSKLCLDWMIATCTT